MFTRLILMFLGLSSAWASAQQGNLLLGVLEDVPGVYAGESNSFHVRVTFKKVGNVWQAFPSHCPEQACLKTLPSQYPHEVAWIIGFDGKIVGSVTAQTPQDFGFYAHVGLQDVTSGSVPRVGKRSFDYGESTHDSVYRPLVANSQRHFKDPQSWKPAQLRPEAIEVLRQRFRTKFPNVSNCKDANATPKPWRYQNEDIKIGKAYSSNTGWFIASVRLEESHCDYEDDGFTDKWFALSPELESTFLGSELRLVDAGDYDDDGRSELVFSIGGHNRGGYELFYDNFKKHALFEFNYH